MFDFTYDNNKFNINKNEFITLVSIFICNEGSKYSDKIINDLCKKGIILKKYYDATYKIKLTEKGNYLIKYLKNEYKNYEKVMSL
jgi:predicted transcriptional regulator